MLGADCRFDRDNSNLQEAVRRIVGAAVGPLRDLVGSRGLRPCVGILLGGSAATNELTCNPFTGKWLGDLDVFVLYRGLGKVGIILQNEMLRRAAASFLLPSGLRLEISAQDASQELAQLASPAHLCVRERGVLISGDPSLRDLFNPPRSADLPEWEATRLAVNRIAGLLALLDPPSASDGDLFRYHVARALISALDAELIKAHRLVSSYTQRVGLLSSAPALFRPEVEWALAWKLSDPTAHSRPCDVSIYRAALASLLDEVDTTSIRPDASKSHVYHSIWANALVLPRFPVMLSDAWDLPFAVFRRIVAFGNHLTMALGRQPQDEMLSHIAKEVDLVVQRQTGLSRRALLRGWELIPQPTSILAKQN